MPGRDELGPDAVGIFQQLAELQPVVAHDAGVRRSARDVLFDEVVLDSPKVVAEVEGVERHIEPIGDAAGIGGVRRAAAPLLMLGRVRQDREE